MGEESQGKFLSLTYLKTRLKEFEPIKRDDFVVALYPSNRALSKSIYIEFYGNNNGKPFKCYTLRVSDHKLADCPHKQFIVEPFAPMTKSKKKKFVSTIESILKMCNKKMLSAKLNYLEKSDKNSCQK